MFTCRLHNATWSHTSLCWTRCSKCPTFSHGAVCWHVNGAKYIRAAVNKYCNDTLFRQCSNLCAVVDILVEKLKIYLFNIDTLNASCKYCDDTIKHSVQEYKQHLNNFLSSTTVKEFMGTLQTKVVDRTDGLESITLKLDESRVDDTLKALNMFLYRFFGNCSRALNHYDTSPGCVCITWLVSTSLVPTLREMAEQHTLNLVSQGILELVIGNLQIKGNICMCMHARLQWMCACHWPCMQGLIYRKS